MGKKLLTDLTKIITTLTDNDLLHAVDVDDPTQDPAGSSGKIAFSNLKTSLDIPDSPDNVVIVKQESDFGTAVAGNITLVNNTIYQVSGQVLMSSTLSLPEDSFIAIKGSAYDIDKLIFIGSGTFISDQGTGAQQLKIREVSLIDGIGNNTLFSLTGDVIFRKRAEMIMYGGTNSNWGSLGLIENHTIVLFRRITFFQCGPIVLNNTFAFTFSSSLKQNFVSTNQPFITIKTNLNQAEITGCAFIPAKGESVINVDPALVPASGISIGPAVPYQGFVFTGIISYADGGGGTVLITTSEPHSFVNGDIVGITSSGVYDGGHVISDVTLTSFKITTAFIIDTAIGLATLIDALGSPIRQPFFTTGLTGSITAFADNGSGNTRVTSAAHGRVSGNTLLVTNTINYDAGYNIVVIDVNNFDLLDSLGNPVPFAGAESSGNWDTSSLNQTNNIVTTNSTGGIIPDSQILGNTILSSTVAFASTTILTRISTGTWITDETERFKATSDGRLIYTGRTTATISISAKAVASKQGGSTSTAFMNIMEKRVGAGSFTEITNHPSSQTLITSSDSAQLTIAAIVDSVSPGDEFGIGIASDTAFTMDIFSIDFNIKK